MVAGKMCPVDVISVCSACGEIRPLRLRMEDEEHGLLRVDIDEVISVKEIQYVGIEARVFLCRATVGERQWLFELKYTIRTHCRCLMRKVYCRGGTGDFSCGRQLGVFKLERRLPGEGAGGGNRSAGCPFRGGGG